MCPEVELLCPVVYSFTKTYFSLLSKVTVPIYTPTSRITTAPEPGQHLYLSDFPFFLNLKSSKLYLVFALICINPISSKKKNGIFSYFLLTIWVSASLSNRYSLPICILFPAGNVFFHVNFQKPL